MRNDAGSLLTYTGGQFNPWLGAELGRYHSGSADRAGG